MGIIAVVEVTKSCAVVVVVGEFEAMWVDGMGVVCESRLIVGVWVVWDGGWWWRGAA